MNFDSYLYLYINNILIALIRPLVYSVMIPNVLRYQI